ncbi:MAG: N-acetylmuramoyl-L-alanine amidase [candidate division Zixibacteria bacterium]
MKRLISIFLVLVLSAISSAEISLEIIYPKQDQELPAVDSTFIFGNVTKGAELRINGHNVSVHEDGGWLAFVPVEPGAFVLSLVAISDNDTASLELPVRVGPNGSLYMMPQPLILHASVPDGEMIYSVGSVFEFTFEAPPGGVGWFSIGSGRPVMMLETAPTEQIYWGDVFGGSATSESSMDEYISYTGHYRLTSADTGLHRINYGYQFHSVGNGNFIQTKYYTEPVMTVIPEFPPLIGEFTGRSQIIRTGPWLGYKLLYLPPGIRAKIIGARDGFYELGLADGVTGYTNIDSVTLLPAGTPVPKGRVSFISIDCSDAGIVISAHTGEKLPFEINETISPSNLDIDIFGVTGDVDWIRYNNHDKFGGLVKWSQPFDDIFRISVEYGKFAIGGYKPYYDGNTFVLEVSKKSESNTFFYTSVKGLKIVIDPGHSHDSGAVGPTGLPEKNANLWIAHELRLMLEQEGADVLMTRYGHEHIPLYDRPKMAEKWGADLLISIHNNALPDGINPYENNGTSVYYYHPHSKPLAEAIHKRLVKATGLPDHGLYYGNLVLTRPTGMPAVLVECAFMMIPEQEAMLKTDKFQRKCAMAILEGIKDYLKK